MCERWVNSSHCVKSGTEWVAHGVGGSHSVGGSNYLRGSNYLSDLGNTSSVRASGAECNIPGTPCKRINIELPCTWLPMIGVAIKQGC